MVTINTDSNASAINPETVAAKKTRARKPATKRAITLPPVTVPPEAVACPGDPAQPQHAAPYEADVHPIVKETILAFSLARDPRTWVPLLLGIPLGAMIPLTTFVVKRFAFHGLHPVIGVGETLAKSSCNYDAIQVAILALIVLGGLVFSAMKMSKLFSDMYGKTAGIAMTVLAEATMAFLPMDSNVTHGIVVLCLSVLIGCNVISAVKTLRCFTPKQRGN